MNLPAKTKRNTLIWVTVVLLVSWVVGYMFLEHQFNLVVEDRFEELYKSTDELFEINVEHERQKFSLELEKIVSLYGLSEAVATKNHEGLNAIISPYYTELKKVYPDVKILTFRSLDDITLLRAHKPKFYGDELNKKRKLIVDTGKLQRSLYGFEVGKLEMTYRVTQPIFYDNNYVGSVEIGLAPIHFIKDINTVFTMEIGLAIDKSLLNIMLDSTDIYIDNRYLFLKGSKKLKQYFVQNMKQNSTSLENDSSLKIKMDIPLENHLSETLGYLVVGFDTTDIVKKDRDFMNKLLLMGVFVALSLVAVMHFGFNMMLKYFTKQVYTDHLTGLKNRQALNDKLFSEKNNVLILSNIKEFSLLNELYGVEVGNEVLKQTAKAFESFAQKYDLYVYRASSDEYVLLKDESSFEADKYDDILEELHTFISSFTIYIDSIDETLGIEIYSGIAFNHAHSLENAQMALKNAKAKALPYLAYSDNVDTKKDSEHILEMKRVIKYALEHKNVIPYFQAITDRDGNIVKYEALVRIIDFENGKKNIIYPDDFLPIAMKSGLYMSVAKQMLTQALSLFATRDEKISVNFLPNDFFNASIMDTFMELLNKFESPQKIVVEITEQEGVDDFDRLVKVVKHLRNLGVLIAIDDFGSGYANYAHILKIKPDYLKIDGSLIKNILTDEESKILVKSIIRFAQDLGIKTIAEYIENEEIYKLLKEYGVDEFQGYHFGRPKNLINS